MMACDKTSCDFSSCYLSLKIPQRICQIFRGALKRVSVFIFSCIQFRSSSSRATTTRNDDPPIENLENSKKEDSRVCSPVIIFKLPVTHENLIYCESNLSFRFGFVENILRRKFETERFQMIL